MVMTEGTQQSYQERLLRVLLHIQRNLDQPLDLDELAGVACFSPFHFHRIFRGMVGESVMEYVRRLRLEQAAQNLRFSDRPVIDVALDAGYESHEAFTRAFSARFGVAPSGYRKVRKGASDADVSDVRLEEFGPKRVAFVRHVGPYNEVGPAWQKLMSWAGMRGLLGPRTVILGVVYDSPEVTAESKLRYDAASSVGDDVQPEGDIGIQEIPRCQYAVIPHNGPYTNIQPAYDRLFGDWLPLSGREPASSPVFERYLNTPYDTKPENLRTEIYLPLVTL
jgi:AraC family transcriptional regulator